MIPKPRTKLRINAMRQATLATALLSLCLLYLGQQDAAAEEQDLRAAARHVTQIIAHRGASAERPECTLAAIRQAIEVGATAVEVDVRTSRDGKLFILHDAALDRTTNGSGPASSLTLAELQQLDAGSSFDPTYRDEQIPSLIEVAQACRNKIDLLLDLKEQGDRYDAQVVDVIRKHGDASRTIVGVRSVAQAKRFRRLLADAKQLALIPSVDQIEDFAEAGAETIRLWPRWLADGDDAVRRVRECGKQLHLNGTLGEVGETLELLGYKPDSLSSDHPARLKATLESIARGDHPAAQLQSLIERADGASLQMERSDIAPPAPRFSHASMAATIRPLQVPEFDSIEALQRWQRRQRERFVEQMLYPYKGVITVTAAGKSEHGSHRHQEFHVSIDGMRLFRFFRLEPHTARPGEQYPAIVCFMGHGKVTQILEDRQSYQHACAAEFADAGYIVYAMENVGMEPERDNHLDLNRSLRLEGHGWYSLLFSHQRMLLDEVFSDTMVDTKRVGVTGVSTGGLLSLSAAVMEPRIAAASVQGIFGSMRISFIRDRHRHCSCGAIPGLLPQFDLPELALLVAPRPLHISNGQTDGFSPAEAGRCVDLITPLYRRAGGNDPQFTISPGGHEFALESAHEFFAEHLQH
jgi:glycerophosphoryl diester phosphodiesterase